MKNRITSPISRCLNKNWRADKIEALVWEKIESVLKKPEIIIEEIEIQRESANNINMLETELNQFEKQLKRLNRDQEQLLQWALKGFPEETIEAENKRINKERSILQSQKTEIEGRIKTSHEAALSIPKMEEYIQLVRDKLTNSDFDMRRLALDMLNIKVYIGGSDIEITGTIPVENANVVTKSSSRFGHNYRNTFPFKIAVITPK